LTENAISALTSLLYGCPDCAPKIAANVHPFVSRSASALEPCALAYFHLLSSVFRLS
jgi:hypothetical protein